MTAQAENPSAMVITTTGMGRKSHKLTCKTTYLSVSAEPR